MKAGIARYQKGPYELTYLAAPHADDFGTGTMIMVKKLFDDYQFDVLVIEPIPYSSGESPRWFLEDAKRGRAKTFISGGESSYGAILADQKKIPFFAGEPDHQDIFKLLVAHGYSELDVFGFYFVRQVPQWIREHDKPVGLFERKGESFLKNYCRTFAALGCPQVSDIMKWYRAETGHELTPDVSTEETAPIAEGSLKTQKMASVLDGVRNRFTLSVIQTMLAKYKRVAVIYGASHLASLRQAFDGALGTPLLVEEPSPVH